QAVAAEQDRRSRQAQNSSLIASCAGRTGRHQGRRGKTFNPPQQILCPCPHVSLVQILHTGPGNWISVVKGIGNSVSASKDAGFVDEDVIHSRRRSDVARHSRLRSCWLKLLRLIGGLCV